MRIPLRWLREYVDFDLSVDDLAAQLTMLGLEIEKIERPGEEISGVVVGQVLTVEPHPDADRLSLCTTDIGQEEPLQIVCGANNMKPGDRVPTATIGGTLPGGFAIARRKMRGIESQGMMCSARELGLGDDHAGLLILDGEPPLGEDIREILGIDEAILEIEVTPNRGDWASMIGTARELAAHLNSAYSVPDVRIEESETKASDVSSVTIENADLCPRYIGRVLKNVTIGPSPQWLLQRLIAAGQRPINNVVDITNYVLLETGQPLHAFDFDRLNENRIVVRNAKPGETLKTIDGDVRNLAPDMLVIADATAPVAVAGVMGGFDSEVGEETVNVFLESAWFGPGSIRSTARALGMVTEASQHFQRGADMGMVEFAMERAAALMQEYAGAQVCAGRIDAYPAPRSMPELTLRYARADLLLGTHVEPTFQKEVLERLGFEVVADDDTGCRVQVPTWRHDVSIEADLIEEVARLFNYGNIETTVPSVRRTDAIVAPEELRLTSLRRHLVGLGLTEIINWSFCSTDDAKKAGLDETYLDMVPVANPLSEKHAFMRSSLVPDIMNTVSFNMRHGNRSQALFELGPVFRSEADKQLPGQRIHLGVAFTGTSGGDQWSVPSRPVDFYDLKGIIESVLEFFGVEGALESWTDGTFADGQSAEIFLKKSSLGYAGLVRSDVRKRFDLDQDVYILDLDLEALLPLPAPVPQFQSIPSFPPSLRDMAVLVDDSVPAGKLVSSALQAGGKLLRKIDIFDVYRGKQVPDGKKSIALSLVFQSDERTLTDKDTQKAWDRILKTLESNFSAELR